MTDQLRDNTAARRQEIIRSLEGELQIALTFAQVSSNAYKRGKLQHAIDARSRAEAAQSRAIADLIESSVPDPGAARSMLANVRHALTRLPPAEDPFPRVKRAG